MTLKLLKGISTGIKIQSNAVLPDLQAVIIADSLSKNGLYHARIIESIPMTQSI
jgi:hypothetical protein